MPDNLSPSSPGTDTISKGGKCSAAFEFGLLSAPLTFPACPSSDIFELASIFTPRFLESGWLSETFSSIPLGIIFSHFRRFQALAIHSGEIDTRQRLDD
jgi:hypothetical protein